MAEYISGHQVKILIVDDVAVVRDVIAKWLSECGYRVFKADDGDTALEVIKCHHPDLIILDVMMHNMNGFDLLKLIKKDPAYHEFKDIDVIMCTAKGERKDVIEAMKLGACDYIVKPMNMPIVIVKILKVLEKRYGKRFSSTFQPLLKRLQYVHKMVK